MEFCVRGGCLTLCHCVTCIYISGMVCPHDSSVLEGPTVAFVLGVLNDSFLILQYTWHKTVFTPVFLFTLLISIFIKK